MIKLSLEIPTSRLKEWVPLTDLDFVLAHKVLSNDAYAEFFSARDARRELILDNSTHEFGRPLNMSQLKTAAEKVHADYVIAPDIVTPDLTVLQYKQNLKWLKECAREMPNFAIGAVLCGHSKQERDAYVDTATKYAKMMCFTFHDPRRLDWWRDFTFHPSFPTWGRVHILGVSTLDELRRWETISEQFQRIVFSVDTCKPLKLGVLGMRLQDVPVLRGGKTRSKEILDLEKFSPEQIGVIEYNIEYLRHICRGEA